jgi:hypothetical protein
LCGPSGAEKGLGAQESSLSNILAQDFGTRFAGQTETLNSLNNTLTGLESGHLLPGYSAETKAALNTEAIDTTGANYGNAARAINGQLAGRGGDSGLESGVDQQIKAGIASNAAGQLSKEQLGISLADQNQAVTNTNTFLGGMNALAGQENPLGYGSEATNANKTAFSEANQINQENNQAQADIIGGVTALAGAAATPFTRGGTSFMSGMGGGGGANPAVYNPGEESIFGGGNDYGNLNQTS